MGGSLSEVGGGIQRAAGVATAGEYLRYPIIDNGVSGNFRDRGVANLIGQEVGKVILANIGLDCMSFWTFLCIYLGGAVLVALRIGWHIRHRMDKYDRMFSDVRGGFWFDVILWPMLLLKPKTLIHPTFPVNIWNEGRADSECELDRLAQNLPPCGPSIRYAPKHDESGDCDSEFVFDATAVEAIMAKRLAELPAAQHGRYPAILNWLRQRDPASAAPTDVPAAWNGHFRNVAVGMMNRGLGQVKCGKCSDIIPQEQISIDSGPTGMPMSGWVYNIWCCPQGHKLLTKDAIHFFIRKSD